MGKRRGKKKKAGGDEDGDAWETDSVYSEPGSAVSTNDYGDGDGVHSYEENPLEYITEALYEKRAATREKALAGLVQYLRASYRYEECDSWKETLAERLAACVKKGKAKEVTLACTAAALMVATLGQSSDGFTEQLVEEFLPLLKPKMLSGSTAAAKVAAIRALGVMCFVGSEDGLVLHRSIQEIQKCFSASSGEVRAEAYTVLALLLSISVPIGKKIVDHMLLYVESFSKALSDESVQVRTAAGNALVVVNEVFGEILQEDGESLPGTPRGGNGAGDEGGEGEGNGAAMASPSSPHAANGQLLDEDLVEKMSQMATSSWGNEQGSRMNKREKANQKRAFRSLVGAMEGGASEKIKLKHGDVLLLDTQSSRVAAAVFKSVLAQGFQVHMQSNDLLHQVFDFVPRQEKIQLSQLEKKMMFSPNSAKKKNQTKQRNKGRMQKSASNQDFFTNCD